MMQPYKSGKSSSVLTKMVGLGVPSSLVATQRQEALRVSPEIEELARDIMPEDQQIKAISKSWNNYLDFQVRYQRSGHLVAG